MPGQQDTYPESIEGRRIIVTGAAGGIGAGVTAGLAKRGAKLGAVFHRTPPSAELQGAALWKPCDLTDKHAVDECFQSLAAELGGLDALINVSGLWQGGAAEMVDDAQIDFLIGANLKTAIFTNQAAFALMKADGGRISISGRSRASTAMSNPRSTPRRRRRCMGGPVRPRAVGRPMESP